MSKGDNVTKGNINIDWDNLVVSASGLAMTPVELARLLHRRTVYRKYLEDRFPALAQETKETP